MPSSVSVRIRNVAHMPHAISHICVCVCEFAYLLLISAAHRVKININAIVDSLKLMNGLCVDSNERETYSTHSRNSFPLNYGQKQRYA